MFRLLCFNYFIYQINSKDFVKELGKNSRLNISHVLEKVIYSRQLSNGMTSQCNEHITSDYTKCLHVKYFQFLLAWYPFCYKFWHLQYGSSVNSVFCREVLASRNIFKWMGPCDCQHHAQQMSLSKTAHFKQKPSVFPQLKHLASSAASTVTHFCKAYKTYVKMKFALWMTILQPKQI